MSKTKIIAIAVLGAAAALAAMALENPIKEGAEDFRDWRLRRQLARAKTEHERYEAGTRELERYGRRTS